MTNYISISRRFALADKAELRDPDYLSFFGSTPDGVYKWPDLFEMTPLVILGEGRSGKTREFEKQVEMLRTSGKDAFFIPLERLHDEDLQSAMLPADVEAFERWKQSPTAVAYFFLDALDELKLREGSLRSAVKKLQRACEPHFARTKLVLSCRPADWQSQIDSQHLEPFCVAQRADLSSGESTVQSNEASQSDGRHLRNSNITENPVGRALTWLKRKLSRQPSSHEAQIDHGSEDFFLEVISKSKAEQGKHSTSQKAPDVSKRISPTVVTLLPLSKDEVREFAQGYSPACADAFCQHLEAHDFWHLYRLPAEIIDALDQLSTNTPLGTLEDQLRLGIQRKLREKHPNKRQALSVEKAQQGAERIALALFLLKKRTLTVNESGDPEKLDIGDILIDWTPEEQQELIGKTLFDPSGVGSVRFHHRATQEYLAALRLDRLRSDGIHNRSLFALLFGEVGGEAVVKPSMAPVAAWLALWHVDIRRMVLEREPALLFRQGLPSALSLDIRAEVLRAYVPQYAGKGWCRAGVGHEELKRVAHPDLSDLVRELWDDAYTGHDSRELLLEMIWLTPMPDCTDLSLAAALDNTLEPHHRTYASWGVLAAGNQAQKQDLAQAVSGLSLPQRVIRNVVPEMVPSLIGVSDFLQLVDGLDNTPNDVHGLNYTIYRVAKSDDLGREAQVALRDALVEAIWTTRQPDCRMYQARSSKDHYQDGLIASCQGTIPDSDEDATAWARALSIAVHFGERDESIIAEKETKAIWSALDEHPRLREAYLWACLDLADDLEGHEEDWPRFIRAVSAIRRSIRYDKEDQSWLLGSISEDAPENRRGIAFQALIYFFDLQADTELVASIEALIADREDWLETLANVRNPQPREPDEWEIKSEARRAQREAEEAKRIEDWKTWRDEILASPDFLMGSDRRLGILYDARKVISQGISRDSTWGHWDSSIIARALGNGFLSRYRQELSIYWRDTDVQLKSERTPEERNSYPASWLLALAAVKAESETDGWATSLSHDEAVRAARISCVELNGFGGYVSMLDQAHPNAVAEVVSFQALAQLQQLADIGQAEIFHDVLYHGTANMKAAVATRIAPRIADFLSAEQAGARNALEYAIRIIDEEGGAELREQARDALEETLSDESLSTGFALSLLATIDAEAGCQQLLLKTKDLASAESRQDAIDVFASVFGDRHSGRVPDLTEIPEDRRVPLVKDLVLRAYQAVRRDEDIEHEGTYTPDLRDNAQDARSFLLETLLNLRLPETLAAIHELAEQPELSHMPDRLRQMAYEMAAQISDMTAHPVAAYQALDRDGAFVPFDHKSLFTAMMAKLDTFEHDILHAEDSPVDALRQLDQETELRRSIAFWLRKADQGVFDFTQEAVVVDENRTDIRFHPRAMAGYSTVELKRETWSVRDLEHALSVQLVGQYLQHENCRAGCLLICQAQAKRWRHPDTNAWMSLAEVVDHLEAIAKQVMASRPELHIAVKGIDYS
jgi:hypothetical protein